MKISTPRGSIILRENQRLGGRSVMVFTQPDGYSSEGLVGWVNEDDPKTYRENVARVALRRLGCDVEDLWAKVVQRIDDLFKGVEA